MRAAARRLGFAEEAHLARLALGLLGGLVRASRGCEQARAVRIDRIEGAGAHQRFEHAAVHQALVDAAAEIVEAR